MSTRRIHHERHGFTIVETLTALALLVLLMGAIFVFMWTARDRRASVVTLASSTRDVLAMLDQIESDLTTAIASDPREGAGVKGDATSLHLVFRSVWLRGSLAPGAARDLQGASYTLDADRSMVSGERWFAGGTPTGAELCRAIGGLRFRYFDGRTWGEAFDSEERGGMPVAVEVSVWRGSTEGPVDWRRTIRVPDAGATEAIAAGNAPPIGPANGGTP